MAKYADKNFGQKTFIVWVQLGIKWVGGGFGWVESPLYVPNLWANGRACYQPSKNLFSLIILGLSSKMHPSELSWVDLKVIN